MEPKITINGILLDDAQSMTIRVALNSFAMRLQEKDALGDDDHGRSMTKAYSQRIDEINSIIITKG